MFMSSWADHISEMRFFVWETMIVIHSHRLLSKGENENHVTAMNVNANSWCSYSIGHVSLLVETIKLFNML